MASHRPAARVVCLDSEGCVLLMHWRDPHDGSTLWEPPGGGIESGETPLLAARRELAEETGLDPAAVTDRWVPVERDLRWNGRHWRTTEQFFLARFTTRRPAVSRAGLLPDERTNLMEHAWVRDLSALSGRLEPPALADVIAALTAE